MTPIVAIGFGPWELGFVLLIVMIIFGAGKLPQVFKTFGQGLQAFRDGQREPLDVSDDKPEDAREVRDA